MFEKSDSATPPTPEWVEAECAKFEKVLEAFATEQRAHFRRRAEEGRSRWDKPENAEGIYTDMLAHGASVKLAAHEETHVANFAAFLWAIRTGMVT